MVASPTRARRDRDSVAPKPYWTDIGGALHACLLAGIDTVWVMTAVQPAPGSLLTAALRYETVAFDRNK